jgi:hypothetical protein
MQTCSHDFSNNSDGASTTKLKNKSEETLLTSVVEKAKDIHVHPDLAAEFDGAYTVGPEYKLRNHYSTPLSDQWPIHRVAMVVAWCMDYPTIYMLLIYHRKFYKNIN